MRGETLTEPASLLKGRRSGGQGKVVVEGWVAVLVSMCFVAEPAHSEKRRCRQEMEAPCEIFIVIFACFSHGSLSFTAKYINYIPNMFYR